MVADDITLKDAVGFEERPAIPTIRVLFEGPRGAIDVPARPLGRKPLEIGRTVSTAGIPLDDPRVSRHHATVRSRRGRFLVEDRSSNGTYLNGLKVEGEAWLDDGDVFRVGDSFLLFRLVPQGVEDQPLPVLIGEAPSMWVLRRAVYSVGPTDAKVLVIGESGTGKELVAQAVHDLSGRKGAFVPVNCGAIPETLAESQLFGHVQGAFTGAQRDHAGYFREADGGTLFLDEIGELPIVLQPKLLRVLESGEVRPVGGTRTVSVEVRVVAATNRDLEEEVEAGRFRGDLYARLSEYVVRTPPLRARREDVLPLLHRGLGDGAPPVSPDLVESLFAHPFKFNVRELLKIAKQLRINGMGADRLEPSLVQDRLASPEVAPPPPAPAEEPSRPSRPDATPTGGRRAGGGRDPEPPPSRELLELLLREYAANITRVAKALGRSRRQVYRWLELHELDPEQYR